MLDAIEKIHEKGYIHRDIKPSNFAIGRGRKKAEIFLLDFGLAKQHLQNNGIFPIIEQLKEFRLIRGRFLDSKAQLLMLLSMHTIE